MVLVGEFACCLSICICSNTATCLHVIVINGFACCLSTCICSYTETPSHMVLGTVAIRMQRLGVCLRYCSRCASPVCEEITKSEECSHDTDVSSQLRAPSASINICDDFAASVSAAGFRSVWTVCLCGQCHVTFSKFEYTTAIVSSASAHPNRVHVCCDIMNTCLVTCPYLLLCSEVSLQFGFKLASNLVHWRETEVRNPNWSERPGTLQGSLWSLSNMAENRSDFCCHDAGTAD